MVTLQPLQGIGVVMRRVELSVPCTVQSAADGNGTDAMLLEWCRALNSPASSIRARPFDILYNLSLHAELLYSPSRDPNEVRVLFPTPLHVCNAFLLQTTRTVFRVLLTLVSTCTML